MSISRSVLSNWDFSWNFILDSSHNGIIAVDKNGYIVIFNATARRILKSTGDVIGRHIREIIPETRLPVVLKTGRPELGKKIMLHNTLCVTHRTPILRLGEVIGALAVFEDVSYLKNLANELCDSPKTSTIQLDSFLNRINILKTKLIYFQDQLERISGAKFRLANIAGKSQFITQIKESMERVASGSSPVLFRGEKGTGKELFAHILHTESKRRTGPFVKVDCSALPENLMQIELFGCKGEKTAVISKGGQIGKFEIADNGTIFMDEIGNLSLHLQSKLLDVLQKNEISRIGDCVTTSIDVRLIAATTQNLEEMVKQGLFREDLYYRLNLLSVYIPPLRDRVEDLELLTQHFIKEYNQEFGKNINGISTEAYELIVKHSWPGNIEELKNVLERVFSNSDDNIIQPRHLPFYIRKQTQQTQKMSDKNSLRSILDDTEKAALLQALQNTNGNKVKAAKLLGISRAGLYQKLEKYNLLNE